MLDGRVVLLVYGEIDLFMIELQDALDRAKAETIIARAPAEALRLLKQVDFEVALINYMPWFDDTQHRELLRKLAGTPALLLGTASIPLSLLSAVPLLLKPIGGDATIAALARLLPSRA